MRSQINWQHKKILVGSANFSNDYGLVKPNFVIASEDVARIIKYGVNCKNFGIDTSPSYGDAEKVIGNIIQSEQLRIDVTSKIPQSSYVSSFLMYESTLKSCERLKTDKLDCLLLHGISKEFILYSQEIRNGLKRITDTGLTNRIGLSCYTEGEIELAKTLIPELNVFQVPENILDQRLYKSAKMQMWKELGNSFFVRSIFLQGLLLRGSRRIPDSVSVIAQAVQALENYCDDTGMSLLELCISYIKSIAWADGFVIGVDSLSQLLEIFSVFELSNDSSSFSKFKFNSPLIDPRNWVLRL